MFNQIWFNLKNNRLILYNWNIKNEKLIHKTKYKANQENKIKNSLFIPYYKMYNKMMLPIELTKILYQNW